MSNYFFIKPLAIFATVLMIQIGNTQIVADFENFNLARGEYINDASPASVFQSGSIELPNFFDPEFNFWTGWSISADTNTTTPGFSNQFSAIPGEGVFQSASYSVGYIFDPIVIRLQPSAMGNPVIGLHITNSTYTYLSMRDGDAFAKKFGGETGHDPDFLMITFKKYSEGILATDSINFFLADYRFNDDNKDYLISDWAYVDLTVLGPMDSLSMRMTSSDNGVFGMNTPAYVCVDHLTTDGLQSFVLSDAGASNIHIGPNPASDRLFIDVEDEGLCTVSNLQGSIIWSKHLTIGKHEIAVSEWPKGLHVVRQNGGIGKKVCLQ